MLRPRFFVPLCLSSSPPALSGPLLLRLSLQRSRPKPNTVLRWWRCTTQREVITGDEMICGFQMNPYMNGMVSKVNRHIFFGRVFEGPIPHGLYLSGNNLSGTIPPQLGNLTELRWLELHNNNLSGSIPSTLGNL